MYTLLNTAAACIRYLITELVKKNKLSLSRIFWGYYYTASIYHIIEPILFMKNKSTVVL